MSRLEELIQRLCPNGVTFKPLNEIASVKRGERITKNDLVEDGLFPVMSGGTKFMGKISKYNREPHTITISSYGAAGYVDFITEKFWANDVCLSILPFQNINNKFLYYYLKSKETYFYSKTTKAIPDHIPTEIINDLNIPVPPMEVQLEIVRILDKFTEFTAELTAELTARKKQYEYYRKMLLTFDENIITFKELKATNNLLRGKRLTSRDLDPKGRYFVYHGGTEPLGKYNNFNRNKDSVMIINVGASAGMVGYSNEEFWSSDGCFCLEHSNQYLNKFLYYFLLTKEKYLQSKVRKAGIPTLDNSIVERVMIPEINKEQQQRIVDILDRFDVYCNDITQGLPAEIKARQQQYKYYRDKLLTFKEAK